MKKTESPERLSRAKSRGSRRILIIEDDASLLKAYREMFKSPARQSPDGSSRMAGGEEFRIVEATTGQEGLTLVNIENPDLILLDIMLPGGMNGFDVLEQLKRDPTTKGIPVIVMTNLDSEEKVAKTIGAKDYLVKANTTKDQIVKLVMDCLNPSQQI